MRRRLWGCMSEHLDSPRPTDPLDELVTQLLECGAVLSQVVGRMVRSQASGRSAPDVAPIPQVAHSLIGDVLADIRIRHSSRDIAVAAAIVREATDAIVDGIFFVGPELN